MSHVNHRRAKCRCTWAGEFCATCDPDGGYAAAERKAELDRVLRSIKAGYRTREQILGGSRE